MKSKDIKLAVVGMGYVGLPLAIEFSKKFDVLGFDIKEERIKNLKKNYDETNEVSLKEIKRAKKISFSNSIKDLADCNTFIISVPTPVNKNKIPDVSYLIKATEIISNILKKNDTVIYESTVYPGATEEVCLPILEKKSKLKLNKDFYLGYSPERINPGDKLRKIKDIVKITSGSNAYASKFVNRLYSAIIKAGTHKAKSIKIAEAAKVIENTQRDLNIALINELSIIFKKIGISSEEVFKAAETKWNFIPFRPGLVGGHCIGVDPYYLTYKSKKIGYNPKIILSGRKLNDSMSRYVYKDIANKLKLKNIVLKKSKILIMGMTFKENCPDTRNSKVFDLYNLFKKQKSNVYFYDPVVKKSQNLKNNFNIINKPKLKNYDCVIIAVKHKNFFKIRNKISSYCNKKGFIYDMKYLLKERKSNYYRI
jgi:UDP-N-acetyl-D-galactosamine dehydrogenase